MPTLHVRNVPEGLYKRIQKLADKERRSLTAEVIQLLDQGLQAQEARRGAVTVLERIRQRAQKLELPSGWVDSVELIREDHRR